uniref:Replicase n=1 Tax=Actinidia seed borne latent virus TaxID=2560282 RepID=A0A3Q9X4C0_9VIRU|nr:replicase [Actinidia seed borne latent virus]
MASIAVRTPYESFFAANSKDDQRLLLNSGLEFVKRELDAVGVHFAYQLSSQKKEALTSMGVSLHPVPFLSHSHPFCKTVENHMLLNVLPDLMGNGKWIFSSIKKRKIDTITKKRGVQASNVDFVNKVICAKDFTRYDFDPKVHDVRTNMSSREFIFPNSYIRACHNNKIFIHDEIHHWSADDMIYFLNNSNPKMLICSVVYPPELLRGIKQPQNPSLYSFEVDEKKQKLFFFPDNCKSEAYEQPLRLDWLFEAAYIDTGVKRYTVKLIKSAYSHHMFQITPGEYVTESRRFFNDFDTIDLSIMHENRFRYYDYIPIKKTHLQKVYSYLLCLKKPDVESGLAKLRQMFDDDQDCRVVEFFSKFCKDIIEKHKNKWELYGFSWLETAKDSFIKSLPIQIARCFKRWEFKNIFDFLFNLQTLSVSVNTRVVTRTFVSSFTDYICEEVKENQSVDALMNSKWHGIGPEKTQKWNIRVMKMHAFEEFRNGSVKRISVLLFLGFEAERMRKELNFKKKKKGEAHTLKLLKYTRDGPFIPPKWLFEGEDEKEKKKNKDKEEIGIEEKEFIKVNLVTSGWYVKVDLLTMIREEEEVGKKVENNEISILKSKKEEEKEKSIVHWPTDAKSTEKEGKKREEIEVGSPHEEVEKGKKKIVQECPNEIAPRSDNEDLRVFITREDLKNGCEITIMDHDAHPMKKRRIAKVVGDGNCFYRALRLCLGHGEHEYNVTREKLHKSALSSTFFRLEDDILHELITDGVYTSDELVKFIVNLANIELRISTQNQLNHFSSYKPLIAKYENEPVCVVHMHLENEHFDAVLYAHDEDGYDQEEEGGVIELKRGNFEDLEKLNFQNYKPTKLKGRKAFFFVNNLDIDYGHDKVRYKSNLYDIESICPKDLYNGYNACLVQIFEEGGNIPMHRDDEICYDDESILSINLKGSATFSYSDGNVTKDIRMMESSYIVMDGPFQKKFKHSVKNCSSGRINVTFRRHIRRMNMEPLVDINKEIKAMKNRCMIDAIADNEGRSIPVVMNALLKKDRIFWDEWRKNDNGGTISDLIKAANDLAFSFEVDTMDGVKTLSNKGPLFTFELKDGHFRKSKIEKIGKVMTELERREMKRETEGSFGDKVVELVSNSPGFNKLTFEVDVEYVMKIVHSFKNRMTGIALSDIYSNGESIFGEVIEEISRINKSSCSDKKKKDGSYESEHMTRKIELNCVIGLGGSGKSNSLQSFLKKNVKGKFLVISPRLNLASDWISKVGCNPNKVRTFETALRTNLKSIEVIIVDELTLFPNGYLDLLMCMLGKEVKRKKIVCIFDIYQSRYHSESDTNILGQVHDVDRIVKNKEISYLHQSYRFISNFFDSFFKDVTINKKVEEKFEVRVYDCHLKAQIIEEEKGRKIDAILVASRDEKNALSGKVEVMTFGESQGLSFNRVAIVLSENSEKQDEYRWMVALTRARISICFIVIYRGGLSVFLQNCGNKLIGAFIKGQECSLRRLRMMSVAKEITFKKEMIGGKSDEVDREERLEGDPFLKPFIFLGMRINSEEPEMCEVEIVEPKGKSHICIAQENFALSRNFDLIRSKELREYRFRESTTNQFCDNYERVGTGASKHTAGPLRFESIYPRHQSNDDLTFWMAVHKRLKFSNEAKERAKLKESSMVGQLLYYNLKEKLNLSFSHDPGLLSQCINDFEVKKLSKSKATIANHSIRSDMDWPMNQIFLFMKSQLCTKYEKQYCDAKAGQTLACFQHMVLVKFAPYCRYMEAMIRSRLPDEIYIHSNKNFNELNDWVVKHFKGETCVESDYEAFDASQDEYIVSFEIAMMEDMGMPNWFINDYIDLKCTLGCKLGHFAIMRFTGEFCTFLFNTLANMAFTFCRYDWRKGQPIAFAGDDMCSLSNLEVSNKFDSIFEKLSLQAKVIRTETPMFCGWRLSKYGIVKEPELVFNRFMIAKERGNVDECLENYAIEVSYAYSLGERLFEVLKSEEQIEYHQCVVRFIIQRLEKIKTKVKDLFSDQRDV